MIAALACCSKIGLDHESEVALTPRVPTPTAASLRPWDSRIAIKRAPFGKIDQRLIKFARRSKLFSDIPSDYAPRTRFDRLINGM